MTRICHVLICALVLLTAWGVRPSNQASSCYVPNYQTPWPVSMCDKTVGQDCVVGRVSFSNATDCCQSQFPNLDHPYGDMPLELDAGIAVCGVVRGASPPPLSCFSGNATCSCWVPTWSPWGCVAAADAECFRGYDVSETQGACCTALISRSESDAINGGCGSICQKNNDGVWSCNKTDSGNTNSVTSPSPAPPADVVEAAKKLPKCRLNGKVVTLKKPVLQKQSRSTSRRGSASDGHEHGSHGCGAKAKDVSMEFKGVGSSRQAGTLEDVVEIDIYFNIMESPKNDSFERVTRTQIEQTVEFMNEKYFSPQLNQGFKFTLKGIYRWEQNEAAWAWTVPELLDTTLYAEADENQPDRRVACNGAWKEYMRKTVLGDQLKRRDVLMAYIVDYQYTGGLQGMATFPSDLFDRETGQVSLDSLYLDGFEGDPSSLTGYMLERPQLGPDLPIGSGGTIAHEVGHWLGLYHTFEDGFDLQVLNATASSDPTKPPFLTTSCKFDPEATRPNVEPYGNRCCELNDLVDDTPRVLKDKNFYNADITCTGKKCNCQSKVYSCEDPKPDLLTNLMDYLDACYADGTFTVGQLLRMREQGMKYRF